MIFLNLRVLYFMFLALSMRKSRVLRIDFDVGISLFSLLKTLLSLAKGHSD